jgi:putative DNA primase/helicase
LEGVASQSTDTVMVLDELGMVEAREASQAFYGLANGLGKQRASRDGSPREPRSWRVLFLSSGEISVEVKLSETPGRRARAGQLVRLLDVPSDRGTGFGVFENGGLENNAGALAKSIKLAATSAYGTAGPEFVRRLIANGVTGEDVRGLIEQFIKATVPAGADGQVERAAQRFGLISVAGELAIKFGIVPWSAGTVGQAAALALARWFELRGGIEPAEARQAIETVRLFIEQHGAARFEVAHGDADRQIANRAGYRNGNGADREWWVLPQVWKNEICGGLDAQYVARVLANTGMLRTQAEGLQCKVRVGSATHRAYVVTASIFEGSAEISI